VPVDRRCVEAMSTNKLTLVLAEIVGFVDARATRP